MVMKFWIFEIAVLYALDGFEWIEPTRAYSSHNVTTCEEFERDAQFRPKDIVKFAWKIIYFWSDTVETNPIIFSLLDSKRLENFKVVVETVAPELRHMEWYKAMFMMVPRPGVQVVFVDGGTPGAFRGVVKIEQRDKPRPYPQPLIKLADVRMKQKGGYLGMMCCEDLTAFVMASLDNLPATEEECKAAAALLDLKGPDGRSYFYLKNITRNEL
ncbi:uncharacterized protein LOC121727868 [Aricia agestis]|uniref:uncharacterized protein LOC121727868 n=1 Tax=Aricia agestis TaxID=91739 RepID=UPI001C2060F3|nr:uncharacterized protein LOC121727868 [Aricia agestis]